MCLSLQTLDLSKNHIGGGGTVTSGEIKLERLDLSYNRLSATDLEWVLSSKNVSVAGNRISGNIPSIMNCSWTESLDLSNNEFDGEIGEWIFKDCLNLAFLNLSFNHFSGNVPRLFDSDKSVITYLNLANNNFSGDLPIDVLSSYKYLKVLDLAFNNVNGELPDSISNLANLEVLDLSSNGLSGSIPGSCGTNLKELYLQNNKFLGSIPDSIGNCSKLVSIDLSFNYLTGKIPASIGELSNLKDLLMWQNYLEGEIPNELMKIRNLENLILENNGLTGTIPEGLQHCTNLNWISLSSNHLTGTIPSWIGKLSNLAILKLGNNSFYGNIPNELGDCKSLIWLDLNSNLLNGTVPPSLSKQSGFIAAGLVTGRKYVYLKNDGSSYCRGSGNLLEFSGIKPEDLNRLPSRKTCNFTRVYMGNTQYTFNNNGSMIFLDLSYNALEGEIPKEFGKMYYLMILNLGHNMLSGSIPSDLGGMRYVAVLDLSHNTLEGEIPNSFSSLSMLSEIDLSSNNLSGKIPESGSLVTFPPDRYANNSGLCGVPLVSCEDLDSSKAKNEKSRSRKGSLFGSVTIGLLLAVFAIVAFIIVVIESKKRAKKKTMSDNDSLRDIYIDSNSHSNIKAMMNTKEALSITLATFDKFDKPLQKLTFQDLIDATNNFHHEAQIGSGGFGDVYKAQLKDGRLVAIKKLVHVSGQGEREFTAEMETIGKVKHRNLVPLLGYCRVGDERLLVYEYMKYGSLEDVLHNWKKSGIKLNWAARRKIAVGAARGLAFLHHSCTPHIIHRDMKSSNVLIDENLEARVSDFGMAREMNVMDTHLSVSTLAGTPGYVPPEYYQSFRCTTKGDVYSYGVVLLELLTGKNPTDSIDFGDNNLVGWVKQHSKVRISDVFDKELMKEDPKIELELLEHLKIACACLDDRPLRRPTMVNVMAMFKEIQTGELNFKVVDMSLKEGKEDGD